MIVSVRKMEYDIPFKELKRYSKDEEIIADTGIYKGPIDNERECEFQLFTNAQKKEHNVLSVRISKPYPKKKK